MCVLKLIIQSLRLPRRTTFVSTVAQYVLYDEVSRLPKGWAMADAVAAVFPGEEENRDDSRHRHRP